MTTKRRTTTGITQKYFILLAHLPKDTGHPDFKTGELLPCEWHIYSESELPRAESVLARYRDVYHSVQFREISAHSAESELELLAK